MENNEEINNYIPNQIISKDHLKTYFENGDIPIQEEFWEWQDSYWHKNDPQDIIPSDRVDLSGKADKNATNLDGENVQNWRTKLDIQNAVSDTLKSVINRGNHSPKYITFTGDDTGEAERDGALGMNLTTYSYFFGNMNPAHTGVYNSSWGYDALGKLVTGDYNSVFGSNTLRDLTTGRRNTAIGSSSAKFATIASHNTILGIGVLQDLTTGNSNIGIGDNALDDVTTQNGNIGIGKDTGTGGNASHSVYIGARAGTGNTVNGTLAIHDWQITQPNNNPNGTYPYTVVAMNVANSLIYGNFITKFLRINGAFSVNPTYIPNAQGDATFTKNIVAKADGSFGWEDKGIPMAFVSPVTLGGISAGSTIPKGTELLPFIRMLLNATQYPTYTNPSQTFTNDKGIANGGIYEIGTTFSNVIFSKTYSQGSIRGKSVNGIWESTTEQGKRGGPLVAFTINGTNIGANPSLNMGDIVVSYGTNTITSSTSYAVGDQPVDSNGNNFQTPLPAANPAMNISFSGVFKAFYGNTPNPAIASGDAVRLLPNANMISTLKKVILVTGTSNVNYHVFLPSSFVVTKVLDLSNSNQDITDKYELLGTFEIPDAAGTLRTYMHYRMINTAPYSTSHNHEINFN